MEVQKFVKKLVETEAKDALLSLLQTYKDFSDFQKEEVEKLLDREKNGRYYSYFLAEGEKKKDEIERKKLAAWLLARKRFGLPYSREKVKYIIDNETDLENLRNYIYKVIKDTYDENLDKICSEKISLQARREGKRIVCGRFSRAFYIDALLLANSKLLPSTEIVLFIQKMRQKLAHLKIDPSYLMAEVQFLENLTSETEVPLAQVKNGIRKLKNSLREYEFEQIKKSDEDELKLDLRDLRKTFDQLRSEIKKFERALTNLPSRAPVYMIFFQRIFPIDAIYMGLLNELQEPFFGEDPEIEKLLAEGGENIYVTPDMNDWLRKCDDWIEALPAYAAYQIIPEDGSYKFRAWVQRNILEEMYKANSENWALNIEEVMMTENISIAREIIAELSGIAWKDEKDLLEKLDGMESEIAYLAVLVEKSYENLVEEIGRTCEREKLLRFQALKKVIHENDNKKNLVKKILNEYKKAEDLKIQLQAFLSQTNLVSEAERYLPLANYPRRELPSIHVLTTLGPGESEFNVKNWLEEGMLLFNVMRKHHLEDKVEKKIGIWRENLLKVGEKVIEENCLEAEIYKLGEGEGKEKRENGVLKTLFAFPEIGNEVAKVSLLLQEEGKDINSADFKAEEPQRVLQIIEQKYADVKTNLKKKKFGEREAEVLKKAREEAIKEFKLEKETRDFLKKYLNPTYSKLQAQREIVVEENLLEELSNPIYRYEATGPFKRYNLLYTPSRVDLGAQEVYSVRDIPKWAGGIDDISAISGKKLYQLYNVAGPVVASSTRIAEFLKVGENFFSRGGVYYLSLTASINLDALRMGDFEFFKNQWNIRGDRIVLSAGETYGGFCVPKEFNLLYAIIIACVDREVSSQILTSFGIPKHLQETVKEDLRTILSWRAETELEMDWEAKAIDYLHRKYPEYFAITGKPIYLSRLPQIAQTMETMGILNTDEAQGLDLKFTYWVNKKAQGLEEINRTGPFRKVRLIYELLKEARKKNHRIATDADLIGVMTASYKEGELKDGMLIPVSDVRFSAGSRKLEIYSKVAEGHILLDIDPEGRKIIKEMFKDFTPPADIRIVGRCTGFDILNYVPNSGLEKIKNWVEDYLIGIGLDENLINTNSIVYGGDLKNWIGIRDLPESNKEKILKDIGGKIHLLVIDKRGPFFSYEEAIQGIDFIDLGIPDPELLQLVDNFPKMIYLMKKGRPSSGLVFADGTSGGRKPTFAFHAPNCRRKVKELFALEEKAVYGCLGIGKETIDNWRKQMEDERNLSKQILDAILNEKKEEAERILRQIKGNVTLERKADEALREESQAKSEKMWSLKDRLISDTFSKLAKGISLEDFDFGKWLIYGGLFIVNGKMEERKIKELRYEYEKKLKRIGGKSGKDSCSGCELDFIMKEFVRPVYHPPKEQQYREISTGLAGSLKAVEEKVARVSRWEERKREFDRIVSLKERKNGFVKANKEAAELEKSQDFSFIYIEAKRILGNGLRSISCAEFGRFLRICKLYLEILNRKIISLGGNNLKPHIENIFSGEEISDQDYLKLVTGLGSSAEINTEDKNFYEEICRAFELTDISLLLEMISNCANEEEYNSQIAKFFDITVNSHLFDYLPYHYHRERSAAFEKLSRDKKFEFAKRYHRWLYTHLRYLITEKTPLKNFSEDYVQLWVGNADENIDAIGVRGETEQERFWFHYARLRDVVVLKYEGFGYPEILLEIEPEDLKITERTNVAIIYPYGNTTVPVALEQGPALAKKSNINLFLSAFPIPDTKNGNKILTIKDGLFYPCEEDLRTLREKYHCLGKNEAGMVLATFKEPLILHGIFFHFTHPLRPEIDHFRVPIIQPLIWEAATHLKCELPQMLKGSGVKCPEQENWYMDDTARVGEKAKMAIREKIKKLAKNYQAVIVKPEKESGGRKSLILPVRKGNEYLEENIDQLAELVYEISKTDNVVIQQVLDSRVRQLYSREFLENMVERFARLGIPVLLDREPKTPLFSYFRQILVLGKGEYKISHNITVVSTSGIANVGQGGLLSEYTDDIIDPKYRDDFRKEITRAAFNSMESQRKYLKNNWRYVLSEYLKIYPEFASRIKYDEIFTDLTGFSIDDIPYEMGDYMPIFLVDEEDNLKYIFDFEKEEIIPLYDEKGYPTEVKIYDGNGKEIKRSDEKGKPVLVPLFDKKGNKRKLYDAKGVEVSSLVMYKIEANPGAGLWRPHNDQLPPERKGEGVFVIFDNFGQRAKVYKEKLG